MAQVNIAVQVRKPSETVSIIDIQGEINNFAETVLKDAFTQANGPNTQAILMDFRQVEYMNSSGIGLLVTLLVRANRQKQRLLAYGLSDHYRRIFELTRLSEAIQVFDTEEEALVSVGPNRAKAIN